MSWLFGSKKTKTVVTSPSSEQGSPPNKIEVNEEDDFMIVNNKQAPNGSPTVPPMYPSFSNGTVVAPYNAQSPTTPVNPLQGVPFQLSKTLGLATGRNQGQEFTELLVQTVIEGADLRALEYDFGVEKSVAREF